MAEEVRAVSWVETRVRERNGKTRETTMKIWARLEPPAIARLSGPESANVRQVTDGRGTWMTADVIDTVSFHPDPEGSASAAYYWRSAFAPPKEGDEIEDFAAPWSIKEIGNGLIEYERTCLQDNFRFRERILAEAETRRLVVSEVREYTIASGKLVHETIRRDYVYDQEPPAGIFEMPPDKPVETHDSRAALEDVWPMLPEISRRSIENAIRTSDEGWREGDFDKFQSVWRFAVVAEAPDADVWNQMVKAQAGKWRAWRSEIELARQAEGFAIRTSAYGSNIVGMDQAYLEVRTKVEAERTDGSYWTGNCSFQLRDDGDEGCRIVYWDVPIEEIDELGRWR